MYCSSNTISSGCSGLITPTPTNVKSPSPTPTILTLGLGPADDYTASCELTGTLETNTHSPVAGATITFTGTGQTLDGTTLSLLGFRQ